MSDLLRQLGMDGQDLLTREYGQRAFPVLEEAMSRLDPGSCLILDFHGVRAVDTSFAREAFVRLLTDMYDGRFGGTRFVLANLSASALDTFETMMDRRKSQGFFLVLKSDGLHVAGHMEPNLHEVFELLKEYNELSAREVAELLDLELNTASTRLKKLFDLGATTRREEVIDRGRQHVYQLVGK